MSYYKFDEIKGILTTDLLGTYGTGVYNFMDEYTTSSLGTTKGSIIDNYLYEMHGKSKTTLEKSGNIVTDRLNWNEKTRSFIEIYGASLDKIYDTIELEFSPIDNYDRTEESTTTYSGGSTDNNTKFGKMVDTFTPSGTKSTTTTYAGSETESVKNNQSVTTSNSSDSYNTNRIGRNTTSYNGDADTSQRSFTDRNDTTLESFNNYSTRTESGFDNFEDITSHIFNDREDVITSHIHGNIGVTTSTTVLNEYVNYYGKFAFWKIVIDLFVAFTINSNIYTEDYNNYFD